MNLSTDRLMLRPLITDDINISFLFSPILQSHSMTKSKQPSLTKSHLQIKCYAGGCDVTAYMSALYAKKVRSDDVIQGKIPLLFEKIHVWS